MAEVRDPIKVAQARQQIREANHRMSAIKNVSEYVGRIPMAVNDKRRLIELLNAMRDEAEAQHRNAVKAETTLLATHIQVAEPA